VILSAIPTAFVGIAVGAVPVRIGIVNTLSYDSWNGELTIVRQNKSRRPSARKETQLQLRLRPAQKALISRAAQLRHTSLSAFVLDHAYEAAQHVVAEELDIVMPHDQWVAFCKALDRPAKEIPRLKRLMSRSTVFDGAEKDPAR
jgi:uncharacterized protein (DUF1778 family)